MWQLLSVGLLALLALLAFASATECDALTFCLNEGESDCALTSSSCVGGTYCRQLPSDPINPATGEITGTCVRAPRVGEPCSNERSSRSYCYDPNLYRVTCDDPFDLGNGTCKYASIYSPGEACTDTNDYINGGCTLGTCDNGVCTTITEGGDCAPSADGKEFSCAPGLFCDRFFVDTPPTFTCMRRVGLNEICTHNLHCQANLVCSQGGSLYNPETDEYDDRPRRCRNLFAQDEGGGCVTSLECKSRLYCTSKGVCVKPPPLSGDVADTCHESSDCQPGWGCECVTRTSDSTYRELGGKCFRNEAVMESFVTAYTRFTTCIDAMPECQGLNYLTSTPELARTGYGPNSCVARCAAETTFDLLFRHAPNPANALEDETDALQGAMSLRYIDVLFGLPEGKCFASNTVRVVGSFALLAAAVLFVTILA